MSRYDLRTTSLNTLLDDPDAVAIVERSYPGITRNPMVGLFRRTTAEKAFSMAAAQVGDAEVARIRAEIEALE